MKKNRSKQKGVASIEFALGFFAFWLMCMAWVEMSYMSYISAIADLSISEASREAKLQPDNYLSAFRTSLDKNIGSWAGIIDSGDFRISIEYLDDIDALTAQITPCLAEGNETDKECGAATDSAIAIYRIDYDFNSIFSYFMDQSSVFTREVIVIQENQRDKFEI